MNGLGTRLRSDLFPTQASGGNCESRNAGTRNGTPNGSNMASHRKLYMRQEARSTVASQQLLRVTAQLSSVGPAAYH